MTQTNPNRDLLQYPFSVATKEVGSVEVLASLNPDALADALERLGSVMKDQVLTINRTRLVFDHDALTENVATLLRHLGHGSGGRSFTVQDLWDLKPVFRTLVRPKTTSAKAAAAAALHDDPVMEAIAAEIHWGPQPWPIRDIYPGVVAVIGDLYSGKTFTMNETLGTEIIVRYGEPFEDVDLQVNAVPARSFTEVLTISSTLAFMGYRVGIDSLRNLVLGLEGAAQEGAVVGMIYVLLTNLNNVFANIGATVLVGVNPMLGEEAKMARLVGRAGSAIAGALWMDNQRCRAYTFRLQDGRTMQGVMGANVYSGENLDFRAATVSEPDRVRQPRDGTHDPDKLVYMMSLSGDLADRSPSAELFVPRSRVLGDSAERTTPFFTISQDELS